MPEEAAIGVENSPGNGDAAGLDECGESGTTNGQRRVRARGTIVLDTYTGADRRQSEALTHSQAPASRGS